METGTIMVDDDDEWPEPIEQPLEHSELTPEPITARQVDDAVALAYLKRRAKLRRYLATQHLVVRQTDYRALVAVVLFLVLVAGMVLVSAPVVEIAMPQAWETPTGQVAW